MGGFCGTLHGADFRITDPQKAYIVPAKMMALTAYHLLKDQAKQAYEFMDSYKPMMTRKEYCDYIDKFRKKGI